MAEALPLPGVDHSGPVVGCFGASALREALVWRRLIQGTFPDRPVQLVFIQEVWKRRELEAIRTAFPPSEHAQLKFLADGTGEWQAVRQASRTTFAAWVLDGLATRILLGGPTDEGWDRFEEAAP